MVVISKLKVPGINEISERKECQKHLNYGLVIFKLVVVCTLLLLDRGFLYIYSTVMLEYARLGNITLIVREVFKFFSAIYFYE